jgi:MFS family permease
MTEAAETEERIDWRALWATGDLARFCFVSLGILLHATNETMLATILPDMVRDLQGVELTGWVFALYELGAIVAGASGGRLVSYIPLRTNMTIAALIFALGAVICAVAPTMPIFLGGRLIEGLGGGALVSLAFVSVERLFPIRIWPQLFGIMSVVWGVAAFTGPLMGAVVAEWLNWRWAFAIFTLAGLLMASVAFRLLSTPGAVRTVGDKPPPFPFTALLVLAVSIILIASAGVNIQLARSSILLILGLAGLALFFYLDATKPASRLFPSGPFNLNTRVGSGLTMAAALCVSTCSIMVYGPLLLTTLHGMPLLVTGYIIAMESIAWSVLAIAVANIRPQHERTVILVGVIMIAVSIAGFAFAVPYGSIPLLFVCAIMQGGGFGVAWPFVTRMIVAAAPENERTVAASGLPAMQRIGYSVGAASCGIVANAAGFSEGLTREAAEVVAVWVFLAFVPLALVGVAAAARLVFSRTTA